MDNKSETQKSRISEGEFRHYVFERQELLDETRRFLEQAGYEWKPVDHVGFVQPDFRTKRKAEGRRFEIAGLLRESMDEAVEALIKLSAIRAVNANIDCVLVLPPINEYVLIEFLMDERGRWYFGMKDAKISMWFVNPDNRTTMCVIGGPSDREFLKHFFMSQANFDEYMSMRALHLIQERLMAEEEEDD